MSSKTQDPRLITAGYKRKKYIYDNAAAMRLFAEWVEKKGITTDCGGMAFPEDLNSAQLSAFWSSEILGQAETEEDATSGESPAEEGSGEAPSSGGSSDTPEGDSSEGSGGGSDNGQEGDGGQDQQQPEQGQQQPEPAPQQQPEQKEAPGRGEAPPAPEAKDSSSQDILSELTGGLLSSNPDMEARQQQAPQGSSGNDGQGDDRHKPGWWKRLLAYAKVKNRKGGHEPILLVGPTGCGKTHVVEELAEHLGRTFFPVSCNEETAAEVILGYPLANVHTGEETFIEGPLLRAIQHGGVFLADEFDALHPNAALVLQTALSNGFVSIPGLNHGRPIRVHNDFLCVATANTFGHGADRNYMGRNVQDKAVMDRFRPCQINIDYDEELEKKIGHPQAVAFGHKLRARCRFTDGGRERKGFNRDISTRNIMAWSYQIEAGIPLQAAVYGFFEDWTDAELAKVDLTRIQERTAIVDAG